MSQRLPWFSSRWLVNCPVIFWIIYVTKTVNGARVQDESPSEACCCKYGQCDGRNALRQKKVEIVVDGNVSCCKPRKNWQGLPYVKWGAGECDVRKYTNSLGSILGDSLVSEYDASTCQRQCPNVCSGHGHPVVIHDGLVQECSCECETGYDPDSGCVFCLPGWLTADDGTCFHPSSLAVCIITMNSPDSLEEAEQKLQRASKGCDKSDIVVIATQELTTKTISGRSVNQFNDFALHLPGYVNIARCGGEISAGVLVLVRENRRNFFILSKPITCHPRIKDALTETSWTNTKGSVVLSISTVTGKKFIAASTHGDRKRDEGRLATIRATARMIQRMTDGTKKRCIGCAIIAWGGDFNPRTPVQDSVNTLLALGTTHPTSKKKDGVDTRPHWKSVFDPKKAFTELTLLPDTIGADRDFGTELSECSQGELVQVKGIRDLCPTYRKADGPGKKSSGGFYHHKTVEWRANFACQAPGHEIEYYESPIHHKISWTGAKSRAPSWTERLIVNSDLQSGCYKPGKVLAESDHDVLYVKCQLSSMFESPKVTSDHMRGL